MPVATLFTRDGAIGKQIPDVASECATTAAPHAIAAAPHSDLARKPHPHHQSSPKTRAQKEPDACVRAQSGL